MKPQWLKDIEDGVVHHKRDYNTCGTCIYFGKVIKYVRHRGKNWIQLCECEIHQGCLNTEYSVCCDDYTPEELV